VEDLVMRSRLILLALLPGLAGAAAPAEFEATTLHDFRSGDTNDGFGWSLATGEIDGDGFADVAIGAPGDGKAGKDAGAVYVFSGRTFELMHVLRPAGPGERFGEAIAFGDVDRDGQGDVVVGAPAHADGKGALYACVKLHKDKPPKPQLLLEGERVGDRLGFSVSAAPARPGPDLEGVLVGAPGYDAPGRDDAGRATVLRFKGDKLKPEVVFEWTGATLGAALGSFVDWDGDQDEDGTLDLLVGEPGAGEGKKGAGILRLLDGADGSLLRSYAGTADGDRFGAWASHVRLHGEGVQYHETVVAAPGGGYVKVFGAREGEERRRLAGHPGETGYGTFVSRSARLGAEYQFAFAVASVGAGLKGPQDFRGLRIYSGENFALLLQLPYENVRALLAVDGLDAEIGDEFLVAEARAEGDVVHVLRVRPKD